MTFLEPVYLYFLVPVSVFLLAGFWLKWRISKRFDEFFRGEAVLLANLSYKKAWLKGAFLSCAFCGMVFASAGPVIKSRFHSYNIMALVDISQSMWCQDVRDNNVPLSRLELAKRNLLSFLERLPPESRFGLGVFAGERNSLFILTSPQKVGRYSADLKSMIQSIQYRWTWEDSTNIGATLSAMGDALDERRDEYGTGLTVILLTDGENTPVGRARIYLDPRKFPGVHFYLAGVGTPEGGPIPTFDDQWKFKHYLQAETGGAVITRLDEGFLKELARLVQGSYKHLQTGADLKILAKDAAYKNGEYRTDFNLSWAFWLGSFILVLLFMIV